MPVACEGMSSSVTEPNEIKIIIIKERGNFGTIMVFIIRKLAKSDFGRKSCNGKKMDE